MRLPSWLSFWRRASSQASSRRPRRHRPALEQLEGRSLPTAYTAASVPDLIADINAANLAGGDNTITLEAGQTYTLTAADNVVYSGAPAYAANGLPVIAANDSLTILGKGATIERSTAAGTPTFRLFDVAAGASLTLKDLTLQGGHVFDYPSARGGAIYNQGSLDLDGVTVQNNVAQGYFGSAQGGGIFSTGSSLTLVNTRIQNNLALGGRGGDAFVADSGQRRGTRPVIYLSPATQGGDGVGGGLYVTGGTVTLTNVTFSSNTVRTTDYTQLLGPVLSTGPVKVGGATPPSNNAILELESTTQGFILPRMTTAQRNALSPAAGMVIFNTDLNKFQGYAGGVWADLN